MLTSVEIPEHLGVQNTWALQMLEYFSFAPPSEVGKRAFLGASGDSGFAITPARACRESSKPSEKATEGDQRDPFSQCFRSFSPFSGPSFPLVALVAAPGDELSKPCALVAMRMLCAC